MILLQYVYLNLKKTSLIKLIFQFQFFEPLEPVEISILFNNNNRPSGEANVEFSNKEDAMRAMSKVNFILLIY